MKDSYQILFEKGYITKEHLFKFGLEESQYIDFDRAKAAWNKLKTDVLSNNRVFIRSYGRNGSGTDLLKHMYSVILNNDNVIEDPTNNAMPEKILNENTNFRKNIKSDSATFEKIQNYQISHIFGRTKNPFLFTAAWNISYIPKIVDPFTGHEARGDLPQEYSRAFKEKAFQLYEELIVDYNELIAKLKIKEKLDRYFEDLNKEGKLDRNRLKKLSEDAYSELSMIFL